MNKFLTVLGAIASVAGLAYILIPKKEEITVSHLNWECETDIQEFKEVEEIGTTVPEGATVTKVAEKEKTVDGKVKKVICYTYLIKKWVTESTNVVTGDETTTPQHDDEAPLPEGKRYGKKRETYTVVDTNGNVWRTDYPRWLVLAKGERATIRHNRFSNWVSSVIKGGVC